MSSWPLCWDPFVCDVHVSPVTLKSVHSYAYMVLATANELET